MIDKDAEKEILEAIENEIKFGIDSKEIIKSQLFEAFEDEEGVTEEWITENIGKWTRKDDEYSPETETDYSPSE